MTSPEHESVEPDGDSPELPEALQAIITQAIAETATDVHIDAWSDGAAIRYRVDGAVQEKELLTPNQAATIINQIKVAAGLDVNVTRAPLDGHFSFISNGTSRSVRATIIPTAPHHRSAHLRLLNAPGNLLELTHLGLSPEGHAAVERVMDNPRGLITIVGPTGSGKTTTLYALAQMADARRQVIASIEDPVEFDIPFVRQIEVDPNHGVTMERGLRSILRSDPDVILVGEISDRPSAAIAGYAALAGRLVVLTIHGREPAAAVESMHYLSVPYYIVGAVLRLIVSQNLVRCLCPDCAGARPLQPHERVFFKRAGVTAPDIVHEPIGCPACHGYGYRGRTGVFEIVPVDDELGAWIGSGKHHLNAIRTRLTEVATRSLTSNAMSKVAEGVTSLSEVLPLLSHGATGA